MAKNIIIGYVRTSTEKQNEERQISNILSVYPDAIIKVDKTTGTKVERPEWTKLIGEVKRDESQIVGTYQVQKRVRVPGSKKLETVTVEKPIYKIVGFNGGTIKAGYTIVFDEISRMSRNAEDGFAMYQYLYEKGVNLIFLKESPLNTDNFRKTQQLAMTGNRATDALFEGVNNMLMILAEEQIKAAFATAQHEVDFLHKRTSEGMREAKINGVQIGQQEGRKLTTKKSLEVKKQILKYCKSFKGCIISGYGYNGKEMTGTLNDIDTMKIVGVSNNTYYKYKRELQAEFEIEL